MRQKCLMYQVNYIHYNELENKTEKKEELPQYEKHKV